MSELANTTASPMATDMPTAHVEMTTNDSLEIADAGRQGIGVIRRLVIINLALVAIQALSAGFLLSGFEYAANVHADVALALEFGALIQAVAAIILWRRRRILAWVAGVSIGLFALVLLQVGLGYHRSYWLHVPIGVGLFGWLTREFNRLDSLRK